LGRKYLNLAEEGATSPENYIGGLIGYQEFEYANYIIRFETL